MRAFPSKPDFGEKPPLPRERHSTTPGAGRMFKIFWVSMFFWFLGFSGARAQYVIGQFVSFIPSFGNPASNPTLLNVSVIDTLPSDVTYVSCSGAPCAP